MLKSWMMEEILIVDKPKGWTSHDVVDAWRKKLGIRKIGHAGTLDPFATGVLILLVGQATKRFEEFKKLEKEYEMIVELGWQTDTGDPEGTVIGKMKPVKTRLIASPEKIKSVLAEFLGEYEQEVPAFSAVKYKGMPLYKYARRGEKIELPKRTVEIKEIELLEFNYGTGKSAEGRGPAKERGEAGEEKSQALKKFSKPGFGESPAGEFGAGESARHPYPRLKIRVVCSSGTYMRSLAMDIGKKLGVPAVAVELRRTRIGDYTLDQGQRPQSKP